MRPAWMDKVVNNIESMIYSKMKSTSLAKDVVSKYPNQSTQELAAILADGMNQGPCGDLARQLGSQHPVTSNYDLLCKEAFENAMKRLLKEEKELR